MGWLARMSKADMTTRLTWAAGLMAAGFLLELAKVWMLPSRFRG